MAVDLAQVVRKFVSGELPFAKTICLLLVLAVPKDYHLGREAMNKRTCLLLRSLGCSDVIVGENHSVVVYLPYSVWYRCKVSQDVCKAILAYRLCSTLTIGFGRKQRSRLDSRETLYGKTVRQVL